MTNKDEALEVAIEWVEGWKGIAPSKIELLRVLREALEQPAQEPVGIIISENDYHAVSFDKRMGRVFWFISFDEYKNGAKLYTHPHQWVGLTDKEIFNLSQQCDLNHILGLIDYGRAVEQTLKDKNHA